MRHLFLALLLGAAGPALAQDCEPDRDSSARVVTRAGRGPLVVAPGRLCADLHGERRDGVDLSIDAGVGEGGFGRGSPGSLYEVRGSGPHSAPRRRRARARRAF